MADALEVKVLGAGLIEDKLKRAISGAQRGVVRGLDLVAADLLERSANLAPILTGDLIRSGRIVRRGAFKSGVIRRIVSYGTGHGVFAHEEITPGGPRGLGPISRQKQAANRSPDGPVGGKFLSRPFQRKANDYIKFIRAAAAVDAGIERTKGDRIRGG